MIQSVRGTKDTLPSEISKWHFIEEKIREVTKTYGYKELRTPIFEKTEVFSRSIGENTDIVNKEMYTFTDKGGESVTLRPEQTAALIRSVVQNNLTHDISNLRLYYIGPYFRYERPQKGRLRQFHQFGAECISSPNPEADVEIILMANKLINRLGISQYTLEINSLGNDASRATFRKELTQYLNSHREKLSVESQNRLLTNPLRVLDSKDSNDRKVIENAPNILDSLDEESKKHFESVIKLLDTAKLDYKIEPNLVRGLDYYCHTVFEFKSNSLGAQDAFGGGGRYDKLIEQMGGKPTPAVGFAMGIERLILILDSIEDKVDLSDKTDIYVVCNDEKLFGVSLQITEKLREKNYKVVSDLNRRSFKSQMREADKFSSKFCIIVGDDEYSRNSVIVKNMQTSEQAEIAIDLLNTITFK